MVGRFFGINAVCSLVVAGAINVQAVTLKDVLQDVVLTNPRILEKQKAYNVALAEQQDARSGYFPKVIFSGDVGYKYYRDGDTEYKNESDGFYEATLTVSQLLYDWGKTSSLDQARKSYMLAALYSYMGEAEQVVYDTITAYLNVLKYSELQRSAEENVLTHENLLESIRMQVESGKKGRSELERINGRMAAAQSRLLLRRNDYKKAVFNLHKLLGRFTPVEDMVMPVMDGTQLPSSLREALALQTKFHPLLREAFYTISQKEWESKNKKSESWGRFSLEGFSRVGNEFTPSDEYEMETRVGLRYNHTLFDAGRSHRVAAAVSQVHAEQQKNYQIRRTLLNDIQLSWAAHKLLTEQIGVLKKNLYFTARSLVSYKKEFVLGRRSLINILDAQNENQRVTEQLVNAVYSREMEKYRVLLSEGMLLQKLGLLNPLAQTMVEKDDNYQPLSNDALPLSNDFDRDTIVDEVDVSVNSQAGDRVNDLGVNKKIDSSYLYAVPQQEGTPAENHIGPDDSLKKKPMTLGVTTLFDFDAFSSESIGLSDIISKKMMKEMVRQARDYSTRAPLYITVSSNESDDPDVNYSLALRRAYSLKRILQQNGVEDKGVFVFADTNAAKGHNVLRMLFTDNTAAYQQQYLTHSIAANIFVQRENKIRDFVQLDKIITDIGHHQGRAEIVLFSNELPNREDNRQLGLKRANLLREYVAEKGINPEMITVFSWGNFRQDPLVPESRHINQYVQYVLRNGDGK